MPDSARAPTPAPLLSMRGITKAFPGVLANDQIDLDIYDAEIHALLGENGAGKSTPMKILYGFYRADAGRILLRGEPLTIRAPHDARQACIGMLFQDFTLIPAFSVAENIALFLTGLRAVLNFSEINRRIAETSRRYGLQIDPDALVAQLSIGEQQKVEILKLLLSDARLLILDEPTRVLAPHEIEALFQVFARLRRDGYAVVLITHKLAEVLECADRITVLRAGHVAGTLPRAEACEDKLLALMFARKLIGLEFTHAPAHNLSAMPVLELCGVETRGEAAETSLKGIDLTVGPGEIVGVAGVSGNGQRELGDMVLGMVPCAGGRKRLFNRDVTHLSIGELRRAGVSFVPENPLVMASVPWMTVLENIALASTWRYARLGGLAMDWGAARSDAERGCQELGFALPLYLPAKSLSGGNLQRMVIIRELAHDPRLIVASYLTRGLDVQSALAARQALIHARENGAGVLLISEDLEELFALSDRLVVLYDGRIVGTFRPAETDVYEVGHLMTGANLTHDSSH
ncbi:MAG TPA: ABC transporter ATP-binding protein [Candidatus Acidoferrales bacterium]